MTGPECHLSLSNGCGSNIPSRPHRGWLTVGITTLIAAGKELHHCCREGVLSLLQGGSPVTVMERESCQLKRTIYTVRVKMTYELS